MLTEDILRQLATGRLSVAKALRIDARKPKVQPVRLPHTVVPLASPCGEKSLPIAGRLGVLPIVMRLSEVKAVFKAEVLQACASGTMEVALAASELDRANRLR